MDDQAESNLSQKGRIISASLPLLPQSLEMERWTPHQIIAWAVEGLGDEVAMTSSFQQQSLPLLHIVSLIAPQLKIYFLDTGYHFPETLTFKEQITRLFKLNIIDVRSRTSREEQEAQYGTNLPQTNPDLCCYLNKVQPLQETMSLCRAWITGIRRDQSESRAGAQIVDIREDGLIKINPMLNWTRADVQRYIEFHRLPTHPLLEQGYKSIGCEPCTSPIVEGEDERAGRWRGKGKVECGLHTVFRIK